MSPVQEIAEARRVCAAWALIDQLTSRIGQTRRQVVRSQAILYNRPDTPEAVRAAALDTIRRMLFEPRKVRSEK